MPVLRRYSIGATSLREHFPVAFTAFVLSLLMGSAVQGAPHRPHYISGTVVDSRGSVIGDATVLLKCGRQSSRTTTGTAGRFQIEVDSPGSCQITVSAPYFKTTARSIRMLKKDIDLQPIVLQLEEVSPNEEPEPANPSYTRTRSSSAVHLEGQIAISPIPINEDVLFPRVSVILSRPGKSKPLAIVHPDTRGRFQFANVKPGRYVLKASLRGYRDSQSVPLKVTDTYLTHVNLSLGNILEFTM
jgi:hypothetical protein